MIVIVYVMVLADSAFEDEIMKKKFKNKKEEKSAVIMVFTW